MTSDKFLNLPEPQFSSSVKTGVKMYLIKVLIRFKQDNVYKAPSMLSKVAIQRNVSTRGTRLNLGTQLVPIPPPSSTPRSSQILRTAVLFLVCQAGIYSDHQKNPGMVRILSPLVVDSKSSRNSPPFLYPCPFQCDFPSEMESFSPPLECGLAL